MAGWGSACGSSLCEWEQATDFYIVLLKKKEYLHAGSEYEADRDGHFG